MLLKKIIQLIYRKSRAKKLGINFHRVATFQLPDSIIIQGQRHSIDLPFEKGMDGEFIEVLLDDCYGVEQLSQPIHTILDIGANVGLFPIIARNQFPQAIIHAYEPNPNLEPYLKTQSGVAKFKYFLEAVGLETGKVALDIREVSGKTRSKIDEQGNIPTIALSQTIERIGGSVDLAKVDCEGGEWLLFEDRKAWQFVQNLSLEYHLWLGHTHTEAREIIENLGFQVKKQTRSDRWYGLILACRQKY